MVTFSYVYRFFYFPKGTYSEESELVRKTLNPERYVITPSGSNET